MKEEQVKNAEGIIEGINQALCLQQIELHKLRCREKQTRLNRYFNSTQRRHTFGRLMCLAHYVKELYTPSYIAEQLGVSRQAVHKMLKDCVEEGWVECKKTTHGTIGYRATETLKKALETYAEQYFRLAQFTQLHSAFDVVEGLQKMSNPSLR